MSVPAFLLGRSTQRSKLTKKLCHCDCDVVMNWARLFFHLRDIISFFHAIDIDICMTDAVCHAYCMTDIVCRGGIVSRIRRFHCHLSDIIPAQLRALILYHSMYSCIILLCKKSKYLLFQFTCSTVVVFFPL